MRRSKRRAVRCPALLASLLVCAGVALALSRTQSGVATDKAYAPVRDEANRPITAGGFSHTAPIVFRDATASSGIGTFRHRSGSAEKRYILETPSGGVALLDYDRDGQLDIYLVNGSTFEGLRGEEDQPWAALFRNLGGGRFENVAERAGVENLAWGFGAAVGDFDNDGWPDLYVANFGRDRLYRNDGDGKFTDWADKARLNEQEWTTAASFGDYDRDGWLDIFVCGYLNFDLNKPPDPENLGVGRNYCEYRGKPVMCGPRGLPGTRDFLYRNRGDGTFEEVAVAAGVDDPPGYYGFAAVFVDVDDDGWLDLAVANDSTPNYLYRNRGDGSFEDISYPAGVALNEYGREQAGMGLAAGDYDNDGRVDLYMTHFSDDYNTLYRNEGSNFFMDLTFQVGLGETTIPFLGWGAGFLDFDNDGFKDLMVANGHVYAAIDGYDWGTTWAQRPLLFHNQKGKRFTVVGAHPESGLGRVVPARGAAFGDLDNDGRVDAVFNCADQQPLLLHNVAEPAGHWISLELVGSGKSPRDAVGARVFVSAGGLRQRGDRISGGSYASHSDHRLHFGLGEAKQVDRVEIHWPSGSRQVLENLPADRLIRIEEKEELPRK